MAARKEAGVAGLALDLQDAALGVRRSRAEIEALHRAGIAYDELERLLATKDEIAALWAAHGRELRAEAARRGVKVPRRYRGVRTR